ncbi:MAG: 7,8-didemethyl-8-hydroxy-5-deazariboflavin synthase subunit CofG [Candidatus Thorarchaeota archaeon]
MSVEYYLSLLQNNKEELISKSSEIARKNYGNEITFSRNIFIPVTRQCRNRCSYCGFVSDDPESWITKDQYLLMLKQAKEEKCSEILLTLGEKPEEKYQSARDFLAEQGFSSTFEYIHYFCEIALSQLLLPHSNLGILSYKELEYLKECNASLGLMLESISDRLLSEGEAHQHSLGKKPSLRLEVIENAGKLKIPFTTGILVGIGETLEERIESLDVLAKLSKKYQHIQEVIVQNFNPQQGTLMQNNLPPSDEEYLDSVSLARCILPSQVSVQIPPNLNRERIIESLKCGANDLGGISPISTDYINPDMKWHREEELRLDLEKQGYFLKERLPVYPQYEKYLSNRIRKIIEDNYRNEEAFSPENRRSV